MASPHDILSSWYEEEDSFFDGGSSVKRRPSRQHPNVSSSKPQEMIHKFQQSFYATLDGKIRKWAKGCKKLEEILYKHMQSAERDAPELVYIDGKEWYCVWIRAFSRSYERVNERGEIETLFVGDQRWFTEWCQNTTQAQFDEFCSLVPAALNALYLNHDDQLLYAAMDVIADAEMIRKGEELPMPWDDVDYFFTEEDL